MARMIISDGFGPNLDSNVGSNQARRRGRIGEQHSIELSVTLTVLGLVVEQIDYTLTTERLTAGDYGWGHRTAYLYKITSAAGETVGTGYAYSTNHAKTQALSTLSETLGLSRSMVAPA